MGPWQGRGMLWDKVHEIFERFNGFFLLVLQGGEI